MGGPWEKYQTKSADNGPWTKYQKTTNTSEPGILDTLAENPFIKATVEANPINVAKKVYETGLDLFDKAGTAAAEKLGEKGVDPRIAAAAGTTIAMAPDIATAKLPSGPTIKGTEMLSDAATGFARRALGYSKRQLGTPFARKQANDAARVALDEGVIPFLGSRSVMAERANNLVEDAGKNLGDIRDSVGSQPIDDVFNNLEELRNQVVQGRTGGIWDDISKRIDKAQESILGLITKGDKVPLADVEKTKKAISDTVSYASDKASQKGTKQIVSAIEGGVENTLKKNGVNMDRYALEKKRFGSGKSMQSAIDNASSAETGNNLIGPTAAFGGLAQIATGSPVGAGITAAAIEMLKRRGSSPLANLLDISANRLGNSRGTFTSPLIALLSQRLSSLRTNQ